MRWSTFSAVCFSVCVALAGATPARAASILIVAADNAPPTAELLARGFGTVDYFDAISGTPTLAQLAGYDAVLAYTNFPPANGVALGDVLADYVDGGGHVVLATYGFSTAWAINGGITAPGYSPLDNVGITGSVSGSLVATLPGDSIFAGVDLATLAYFQNPNFAHPGLDPGATLLATDGAGNLMIARNAAGNVIGFNLFPSTGYGNNGEFYDLLANTLTVQSAPEPASMVLLATCLAGAGLRRWRTRRA